MFDLQFEVETSSEGRKAHAAFMVVSLCIHLVVLGLVLVISRSGSSQSVIRAPVRITYFSQALSLPPQQPTLNASLPAVPTSTAPLAMRPVTVPVNTEGAPAAVGPVVGGGESVGVPSDLPVPGAGGNLGQTSAPVSVKVRPEAPRQEEPPPVATVASVEAAPPRTNTQPQVISPREDKLERPEPTPPPVKKAEVVNIPPPREPTRPAISPDQIVVLNSSMPSPRRTKLPIPNYPPIARSQRITGEVVVAVTVDTNGVVTDAEVVSSPSPLLNSEAVKAARQLRYEPYLVNGTPVRFRVTQGFKFGLQ